MPHNAVKFCAVVPCYGHSKVLADVLERIQPFIKGSSRISGKFDISKQIRYFTKPPPVPLLEKGEAIRHLTSAPPPCMSEGPTNSVKVVAFFCQGHYGS